MAKNRQPIELIVLKGKKHLTKEEVEKREKTGVNIFLSIPEPPMYLCADGKRKFTEIAEELYRLELMSELDKDVLGFYVESYFKYLKYQKMATSVIRRAEKALIADRGKIYDELAKIENLRDKTVKQCRNLANDMGLTITSRCRLVVPRPPEQKKENKFERFKVP